VINFISNLPHNLRSGGFSAMNAAALAALRTVHDVHYTGPINPRVVTWQKAMSKALRVAGAPGDFYFFSRRRLSTIAREVEAQCARGATLDFFHGFTPWILTRPRRPYIAWSDCTFRDYVTIFHHRAHFRAGDLERIEHAEAAWLTHADRVLFTSNWAAERAVNDYRLDPARVCAVGIFGEVDMPARDLYADGKAFAFISTDFAAKGGGTVLAAFREVRKRHPDATLVVVGDSPPVGAAEPGLTVAGFLRKEVPEENARFLQILGSARALVNATRSDISPLLVVEAGYFGCPVISSRRFAIPELVDHGRTGLLLDDSSRVEDVAGAMAWMLEQEHAYLQMREAAWAKAHADHSRRRFEQRLLASVSGVVAA
jgi:glycosyltransferase involved in cell wall biosynthesis